MMRNGLSYFEASNNANNIAKKAYNNAVNNGATEDMAKHEAFVAYEKEMSWYERKEG